MRVLPVVERELRGAARRRATYWYRSLAGLAAGVLFLWVFYASAGEEEAGRNIFWTLASVAFGCCLLGGVAATADSVSGEKRAGTLGLLFLTDLKGYDVALGKLAASSLNGIYGLLAILPVLALPLVLGGVPIESFVDLALVLTATLFLSLSAGLAVSTFSWDASRASSGTFLLLLGVSAGLPALGALLKFNFYPQLQEIPQGFRVTTPFYPFIRVMESVTGQAGGPGRQAYWVGLGCLVGQTALFLGLAAWGIRWVWREGAEKRRSQSWSRLRRRLVYGSDPARVHLRRGLLAINPMLWLVGRNRAKPYLVWGLLGVLGGLWLSGWYMVEGDQAWLEAPVGLLTLWVAYTAVKFWVASESCRHVIEDRRTGTLELLFVSPLSVSEWLKGLHLAMHRQFAGPVVALVLANAMLLIGALQVDAVSGSVLTLPFGALAAMLIFDYFALRWVGIWSGLTARGLTQAVRRIAVRVLILPWAVFIVSIMWLALSDGRGWVEFEHLVVWWLMIGGINNAFWMGWARAKLRGEARRFAAQPEPVAGRRWPDWLRLFPEASAPVRELDSPSG